MNDMICERCQSESRELRLYKYGTGFFLICPLCHDELLADKDILIVR